MTNKVRKQPSNVKKKASNLKLKKRTLRDLNQKSQNVKGGAQGIVTRVHTGCP